MIIFMKSYSNYQVKMLSHVLNADTVKKTLQKIDIARRMRVSRNPDNADIKQEYEVWKKSMRKMRDQYYSGGITAEYFLDWLEAHKRYNQNWKSK